MNNFFNDEFFFYTVWETEDAFNHDSSTEHGTQAFGRGTPTNSNLRKSRKWSFRSREDGARVRDPWTPKCLGMQDFF